MKMETHLELDKKKVKGFEEVLEDCGKFKN
jgi:hypothetical protein